MLIIHGLANLTIWNQFDDYVVRFIEGLRNIDFDHNSMSIEMKGKTLSSRDNIRFSILKNGEK